MLTIVAIAAVVIAVFLLLIVGISFFLSPKPFNLSGTHVLVSEQCVTIYKCRQLFRFTWTDSTKHLSYHTM